MEPEKIITNTKFPRGLLYEGHIPYEYFCRMCNQLRLCLDPELVGCGNCGSLNVIIGEPNSLDKDKLKKESKNES